MDWAAQIPDMTAIENLWKTLGQNVTPRNPSHLEELWEKLQELQEEWTKITVDKYQNLVKSCERRCAEVI